MWVQDRVCHAQLYSIRSGCLSCLPRFRQSKGYVRNLNWGKFVCEWTHPSSPTRGLKIRLASTRIMIDCVKSNSVKDGCIYLDYNGTTPIWPEVAEAMKPYLEEFGNPSSTSHVYGKRARNAVDNARNQVAKLIGARPEEIYFTSCGTESDNWAIWGTTMAARMKDRTIIPHVVTSSIEHPAVLKYLESLEDLGLIEFSKVPVSKEGIIDPSDVEEAIDPSRTVLVTVMHSNNETGAIQPVEKVAQIARKYGVLMHSDAAQSIGKVSVNVKDLDVDMMTIVGHKFGAPKGVAALFCKKGLESNLQNFLCGGSQESGHRAGTENLLHIVGLGKAAEIASHELPQSTIRFAALRNELQYRLQNAFSEGRTRVNGPLKENDRLPNTLNISILGVKASSILSKLGDQLAASAGAACHTGGARISDVLAAMQVSEEWAAGTIRLSVGRGTKMEDIEAAVDLITKACRDS